MLIQLKSFLSKQGKGLALVLVMGLGLALPQLHTLTFLIQYLLMSMLFFAFLDIEFNPQAFQVSVLWVLLANVAMAFLSYAILSTFDLKLALSAFMTAIAPTAIAAPVIIGFIGRKVEYVLTAVILTNLTSAIVIPLALPFLLGDQIHISIWDVLQPVLIVMLVPLVLARLATVLPLSTQALIRKGKGYSFLIWLFNLVIVSANASNFLRTENTDSLWTLMTIALISLVLCAMSFGIGALIGGYENWQEASQSLGQKNLSFVIWVALTFINPLVAMGPMFYILYHHIYNSWSIYQYEKRRRAESL